jgi:hypothetical protein
VSDQKPKTTLLLTTELTLEHIFLLSHSSEMSKQETADNEYTLAHLFADLEQTKSNLTAIRIEYNITSTALRNHEDNTRPLPQQLGEQMRLN